MKKKKFPTSTVRINRPHIVHRRKTDIPDYIFQLKNFCNKSNFAKK